MLIFKRYTHIRPIFKTHAGGSSINISRKQDLIHRDITEIRKKSKDNNQLNLNICLKMKAYNRTPQTINNVFRLCNVLKQEKDFIPDNRVYYEIIKSINHKCDLISKTDRLLKDEKIQEIQTLANTSLNLAHDLISQIGSRYKISAPLREQLEKVITKCQSVLLLKRYLGLLKTIGTSDKYEYLRILTRFYYNSNQYELCFDSFWTMVSKFEAGFTTKPLNNVLNEFHLGYLIRWSSERNDETNILKMIELLEKNNRVHDFITDKTLYRLISHSVRYNNHKVLARLLQLKDDNSLFFNDYNFNENTLRQFLNCFSENGLVDETLTVIERMLLLRNQSTLDKELASHLIQCYANHKETSYLSVWDICKDINVDINTKDLYVLKYPQLATTVDIRTNFKAILDDLINHGSPLELKKKLLESIFVHIKTRVHTLALSSVPVDLLSPKLLELYSYYFKSTFPSKLTAYQFTILHKSITNEKLSPKCYYHLMLSQCHGNSHSTLNYFLFNYLNEYKYLTPKILELVQMVIEETSDFQLKEFLDYYVQHSNNPDIERWRELLHPDDDYFSIRSLTEKNHQIIDGFGEYSYGIDHTNATRLASIS
ncbi:BA75_00338T0 [Komagataella pastoris]|uniref:BA75_00338T0 n=1 Tax=Komagataella pastoris TaxID=4922 RepID=A0A1B2J7S5_PICPA|nr:BA75_00338T0 [Komagataella pastoris]